MTRIYLANMAFMWLHSPYVWNWINFRKTIRFEPSKIMARKRNPLVFLDISIGDDEQGERKVFEVFLFLLPFL
jgi:hypothetical protein